MSELLLRRLESADIPAVMEFLRQHLGDTHIFANDYAYLDYFFRDKNTGRLNIACAFDENSLIAGIAAYTTLSFFDAEILENDDFVWLTNWLVRPDVKGGAGLSLYMKVLELAGCKSIGTVGQNAVAESIYKKMRFNIGELTHYYQKRHDAKTENAFDRQGENAIKAIEPHNALYPRKTAAYIINKYLKSPYYDYMAYGNERFCVIVKIQHYPQNYNKKCVRIVELYGDVNELNGKNEHFQALLIEHNADYVDFYCHGIDNALLSSCGFTKKDGSQAVIPSYFEPFVNENIAIRFAYNSKHPQTAVFKGDCDREFPRMTAPKSM